MMEIHRMFLQLFKYTGLSSGTYLYVFIAVVSYRTWLSDGSHHPQGLLLFSIGLSNAIFEGYHLIYDMLLDIEPGDLSDFNVCTVFMFCLSLSCIFFGVCQISMLCSFYCIKLISSQHWIIQVLKSRLPSTLPWIISGAVVMSIVVLVVSFGLIFIWVPVDDDNSTFCKAILDNSDFIAITLTLTSINYLVALPFCLILVSLSCTTFSLIQHVRRTISLDRSHLEAHIDAAKTMILLLTLNTSFYVSKLVKELGVLSYPLDLICEVLYYLFWPLQALTLIFRTKKLHRSFIWCLHRRSSEQM
ncbi:taste receptor type 2 member 41-like [Engystomops pustulosus]|uniref:taste receptor type 2 member 41-like n=1 Tax=Engystomops pustulosus TaxID=76066 RepID=UPI003AFA8F19